MSTGIRLFQSALFVVTVLALSVIGGGQVYSQDENASLSVVVSAQNTSIQSMSVKELRKLYLGKSLKMPDGTQALLVVYKPLQSVFNKSVLRRNDAQVAAAWSRLKFSGRSKEPEVFNTIESLTEFLSENSSAIAYLPSSGLSAQVRSVLKLPY